MNEKHTVFLIGSDDEEDSAGRGESGPSSTKLCGRLSNVGGRSTTKRKRSAEALAESTMSLFKEEVI